MVKSNKSINQMREESGGGNTCPEKETGYYKYVRTNDFSSSQSREGQLKKVTGGNADEEAQERGQERDSAV